MRVLSLVLAFILAGFGAPAFADSTTVTVSGQSNPFLAGQPDGTSCCSGDVAPAQSPVLAPIVLVSGSTLTFSATGSVDNTGGAGPGTADGSGAFDMTDYGIGVAAAGGVNLNALIGVFLTDDTPTSATQPGSLHFDGLLGDASYAPGLAQIFWIGDGLTGTGSGDVQTFFVPTGATRLYLGTTDGFQWANNAGSFEVTINSGLTSSVPEPSIWMLMIAGFGALGLALRARRKLAA